MIKLIASDVDGTLLPEGTPDMNPELLQVIHQLKEKGIIFAAASGRQYLSMYKVFEPIQDDMIFIAENGGYVVCRGKEIECCCFDREMLTEIVEYIRNQEGCFLLVTSPLKGYTDSRDSAFVEEMRRGYKLDLEQVEDVLKLEVPIVKVAMHCQKDAVQMAEPAKEHFKGRLNIMAAGDKWVDFMGAGTDKGAALARIQKMMGITREETMAFGDNNNDIGMLNCAGESYAVANAREEVKAAARHLADSNRNDGVLKVLKTLL